MSTAMESAELGASEHVVAIVPARDRADRIAATVVALGEIDAVDRVLVVDDGSTDATADAARAAGADVLVLPTNRGKGGAVAAGVAATPEATVYLLIDADLAATAGAADALLAPVLDGAADMTVGVLPPSEGRGGFGSIRRLSAWGIRRASGLSTRAPLSGQRAVRASYLRPGLASSARFGLEVAMTIDLVRAGARVAEIDVPMDHRHTGRSLRGFAHRGRQGIDIVAALAPRLVPERRRIIAVALLTLLVLVGATVVSGQVAPTTEPLAATPSKVVVFGFEPFGFDDLSRGLTPNLDALVDRGATAAMSVRGVSRIPTAPGGYATLSAGARMTARAEAGVVVEADEDLGTLSAARYLEALTGVRPRGAIVALDGPTLADSNDTPESAGTPGTLAELLRADGHRAAVVANSDLPEFMGADTVRDRSAGLASMDTTFGVAHGSVDPDVLLVDDAAAPFGVRADPGAFAARTAQALTDSDLVVIDPGDLSRAELFAGGATDDEADRIWDAALAHTDAVLGRVVDEAPPDTLFLVVSVRPPDRQFLLTPLVMAGPGVPEGVVTSPSTQRTGLVALTDIAPTILSSFGITVPDEMPGNAVRYEAGSNRLDLLETYDADTLVRERTYLPTTWVYIWVQAAVYLVVLFLITRGRRFRRAGSWLRPVMLSLAAMPAASFLVRLVPGLTTWFFAAQSIVMFAFAVLLGVFAHTRRRNALSPVTWLCGITIAVIVVDIWTGTQLEASSWLGYSFHSAGRFYGVPNTSFAVLGACAVLWPAIMMHYTTRRTETLWWSGCMMAIVLFSAGAPMLGADVGTLITLGPIFALELWVLSGRRIRPWSLVLVAAGAVVLVVGAAGLDLARAPADRSHLGRFASDLIKNGPSVLNDAFFRKQSANFRILRTSIWTRLLPVVALFWFVPLVWQQRAREVFASRPMLRVGALFVLAAAALGFASNDSGPLVITLFVAWLLPFLALLLSDIDRGAPELVFADGSPPTVVPDGPVSAGPARVGIHDASGVDRADAGAAS